MEAEDGSAIGDGVPLAATYPKAANSKKEPKEEPVASDDQDDIPLQKSIGKKNVDAGNPSRVKKEEIADYTDSNNLKDKMKTNNLSKVVKKEEAKINAKIVKAKKSDHELPEDASKGHKKNTKNKNKREDEEKKVVKKLKNLTANMTAKEKKIYDLPGQKHDPPQERDPLRIFYETLYKQVPKSEMAAFWMMEWGLLSKEEAKKVYEKKLKKGHQQNLASPTKTISDKKSSRKNVTVAE